MLNIVFRLSPLKSFAYSSLCFPSLSCCLRFYHSSVSCSIFYFSSSLPFCQSVCLGPLFVCLTVRSSVSTLSVCLPKLRNFSIFLCCKITLILSSYSVISFFCVFLYNVFCFSYVFLGVLYFSFIFS